MSSLTYINKPLTSKSQGEKHMLQVFIVKLLLQQKNSSKYKLEMGVPIKTWGTMIASTKHSLHLTGQVGHNTKRHSSSINPQGQLTKYYVYNPSPHAPGT